MNTCPVKYKTTSGPKLRQTTNINDCQDIFYASKYITWGSVLKGVELLFKCFSSFQTSSFKPIILFTNIEDVIGLWLK